MIVFTDSRIAGKSTEAIKLASSTRSLLIAPTEDIAKIVKRMAREMNYPVNVVSAKRYFSRGYEYREFRRTGKVVVSGGLRKGIIMGVDNLNEIVLQSRKLECGTKQKYVVFKIDDCNNYLGDIALKDLTWIDREIAEGREKDCKKPVNEYLVINTDEPYSEEVIEILEKHGHWG